MTGVTSRLHSLTSGDGFLFGGWRTSGAESTNVDGIAPNPMECARLEKRETCGTPSYFSVGFE